MRPLRSPYRLATPILTVGKLSLLQESSPAIRIPFANNSQGVGRSVRPHHRPERRIAALSIPLPWLGSGIPTSGQVRATRKFHSRPLHSSPLVSLTQTDGLCAICSPRNASCGHPRPPTQPQRAPRLVHRPPKAPESPSTPLETLPPPPILAHSVPARSRSRTVISVRAQGACRGVSGAVDRLGALPDGPQHPSKPR